MVWSAVYYQRASIFGQSGMDGKWGQGGGRVVFQIRWRPSERLWNYFIFSEWIMALTSCYWHAASSHGHTQS